MFERSMKKENNMQDKVMISSYNQVLNSRLRRDMFYVPGLNNLEQLMLKTDEEYSGGVFTNQNISFGVEIDPYSPHTNTAFFVPKDEDTEDGNYYTRVAFVSMGNGSDSSRVKLDEESESFHIYVKTAKLLNFIFSDKRFTIVRGFNIPVGNSTEITDSIGSNESIPFSKKSAQRRNERNIAINALYEKYESLVDSGDLESTSDKFLALAAVVMFNLPSRPKFAMKFAKGIIPLDKDYQDNFNECLDNIVARKKIIESQSLARTLFIHAIFGPEVASGAEYWPFKALENKQDEKLESLIDNTKKMFAMLSEHADKNNLDKKAIYKDASPFVGHIDEKLDKNDIQGMIAEMWRREYPGNRLGNRFYSEDNVTYPPVPKEVVEFLYHEKITRLFDRNDKLLKSFLLACEEIEATEALSMLKDDDGDFIDSNHQDYFLTLSILTIPLISYYANSHFNLGIDNNVFVRHFTSMTKALKNVVMDSDKKEVVSLGLSSVISFLNNKEKLVRYLLSWSIIQEYLWGEEKDYDFNGLYDDEVGRRRNYGNNIMRDIVYQFVDSVVNDENANLLISGKVTPGHYYKILVHHKVERKLNEKKK